jgi:hypothetical protein
MIDNRNSINLTPINNSLPNDSDTSIESTEPLIEESENGNKRKNPLILFVVSFALVLSTLSVT